MTTTDNTDDGMATATTGEKEVGATAKAAGVAEAASVQMTTSVGVRRAVPEQGSENPATSNEMV